jgi:phosphohistidine phosphatase
MRTLYLLRHAKSSWKDESQLDFERPLASRGRKACSVIAKFIQSEAIEFDLLLSSTAVRARETIELIRQQAKLRSELRYDERIYEAPVTRLVEIISEVENDRKVILLVGHNPGMEELIHTLTGEERQVSTASLAKIKLKVSKWSEVGNANGTLEWIVRPKELVEQTSKSSRDV